MRDFYPAFLDLSGKEALLVGGGPVALQKARALARAGAKITVVAPAALPALAKMKNVRHLRRNFRDADVEKGTNVPWIVVAATDDEALNARVSRLCRARRIWANVVDRPALCGFIVPATARRGLVTFAVSTGGASPALAKALAGRLRGLFGPGVSAAARALAGLRPALKSVPMAARIKVLEKTLDPAARAGFTPAALGRMKRDVLTAVERLSERRQGA